MILAAINQDASTEAIPYKLGPDAPDFSEITGMEGYGYAGNAPKAYGQWLQQAGRQKWVKAKRK